MRNVDSHLLEGKMDETVNQYITSHQPGEPVHVDSNGLALNIQDDGGNRVVTVMHPQSFPSHMCRQVSVGVGVGPGPPVGVGVGEAVPESGWEGEELLDTDGRIAALVAHLAQHARPHATHPTHATHATHATHPHAAHVPASHPSHPAHHPPPHHAHKVQYVRSSDVDASVILDAPMRLFNGQTLEQSPESIVVEEVHQLPLPPLQDMKLRSQEDWFNNKSKTILKDDAPILTDSDGPVLDIGAGASPAQTKQNKKSLPHKKRISRKLKRSNGSSTPQQQNIVVINCTDEVQQEEILPDNFVTAVQHQQHIPDTHHITHEVRPIFICLVCGEFYGDEQFKFYQHLKQHYEPHIIIENPVSDLGIDKMTNTCIVDNVATLPDSIVELSLENTVPKTMYQPMDKHILYTSSDKTLSYSSNKMQYSMASMDKEPVSTETEKTDLYDTLDKLELYSCVKCNKSFRKQKQCEAHIKEAHGGTKLEDIGEFSEPEDLMEGIHVAVEEGGEHYEQTLLPHLTVENGHVHQEHIAARHWYMRNGGASPGTAAGGAGAEACAAAGAYCPVCPAPPAPPVPPAPAQQVAPRDDQHAPHHLKEEVLQRIFETDSSSHSASFAESLAPEPTLAPPPPPPPPAPAQPPDAPPTDDKWNKKKQKKFECSQCGRVFLHRSSLMYHLLSHSGKQHFCRECGKSFYTAQALMVHKRTHSGARPCKCDECGREFRQRSDLRYHLVSIHSDKKQFKCEFCNKEFARKYSLSLHRRIHTGERNYKCDYCHKTFSASAYRLNHMRTHTGDKPFKCEDCGKCFRVGFDLRRHRTTHEKARARLEDKARRDAAARPQGTQAPPTSQATPTSQAAPTSQAPPSSQAPPTPQVTHASQGTHGSQTTPHSVATAGAAVTPAAQAAPAMQATPARSKSDKLIKLENIKIENIESISAEAPKSYRKNAVASTARPPTILKTADKKPRLRSRVGKKDGAPNVTVARPDPQYKVAENDDIVVFEVSGRSDAQYAKLKDSYDQPAFNKARDYPETYKADNRTGDDRDPFRNTVDDADKTYRGENTDGKLQVYTHREKKEYGSAVINTLTIGDMRILEREVTREVRLDVVSENMENAFLERLTALYNMSE